MAILIIYRKNLYYKRRRYAQKCDWFELCFRCEIDPASFTIEVRAQIEIKENEEITTRYFGPWEGQPSRQLKIQQKWNFICNCLRCRDPSDLGTYFSAIKCLNCSGHTLGNQEYLNQSCNVASTQCGYILPMDGEVLGGTWECNSCGEKKNVSEIEHILKG